MLLMVYGCMEYCLSIHDRGKQSLRVSCNLIISLYEWHYFSLNNFKLLVRIFWYNVNFSILCI